jgi:hypothetical protein
VSELAIRDLELYCAAGARYDTSKECLPGTRVDVLQKIIHWISDTSDHCRTLVLFGEAGSGKSAIAHSIARWFDQLNRLGSSFCFDRSHQDRRPVRLFATIARDIADLEPEMKKALSTSVSNHRSLLSSNDIKSHFEQFLLGPIKELALTGPIVIVIDALDESAPFGSPDRRTLLSVLANQVQELPSNLRLLVTSRPERDIEMKIRNNEHVYSMFMSEIDNRLTLRDIEYYTRTTLHDMSDDFEDFDKICGSLSRRSEGNFQWAATACRFIQGPEKTGLIADERTETLLVSPSGSRQPLDELYMQILKSSFGKSDDKALHRYKLVLGHIFAAMEPLSINTLKALLLGILDLREIRAIVEPMASLLRGASDFGRPLEPLHTSFRDFVSDHSRSSPYDIDTVIPHQSFSHGSLEMMTKRLRFNICELPTSYMTNTEHDDLEQRIKQYISPACLYSVRYWARHLESGGLSSDTLRPVEKFLDRYALFWIEVLSILGELRIVMPSLRILEARLPQVSHINSSVQYMY